MNGDYKITLIEEVYMDIATWILTLLAIVGVVLNAQKKVSGFYFWIPSNLGWLVVGIITGVWAQAALFGFYTFMCFYGIKKWNS